MPDVDPLIVTAELDAAATARLDALRREHFPPERLQVGAHLTLFHALPGAERAAVEAELRAAAAATAPLEGAVAAVLGLGRGVAYRLDVPGLDAVHSRLAGAWRPWLTRQDQQPLRPHVTVQNKVHPAEAKALLETLRDGFEPWPATVEALGLFHYRGGPWEPAARVPLG